MSAPHSDDQTQVQVVFQVIPLEAAESAGYPAVEEVFSKATKKSTSARDVCVTSEATVARDSRTFESVVAETPTFRGTVALNTIVWRDVLEAIALAIKPYCEAVLQRVHVHIVKGDELHDLPGYGEVWADAGRTADDFSAHRRPEQGDKPTIPLKPIDRDVA